MPSGEFYLFSRAGDRPVILQSSTDDVARFPRGEGERL